MNKKIEQLQIKLQDSKLARERMKARYDAHVVILDGQRNMLRNLEEINHEILHDLTDSDNTVGEFNRQLKEAIDEFNKEKDE